MKYELPQFDCTGYIDIFVYTTRQPPPALMMLYHNVNDLQLLLFYIMNLTTTEQTRHWHYVNLSISGRLALLKY